MKILYSPINSIRKINYSFENEKIIAEIDGVVDEFDFSNLPDGELELIDEEGTATIKTILSVMPIVSAKRINNDLEIVLKKFYDGDVVYRERFPEWQVINNG